MLLGQAASFPDVVGNHEGLLRDIDPQTGDKILSGAMDAVRRQQEETAKKHPNSPSDDEDLRLARLMQNLERAKLEHDSLGKKSLGVPTTIDGKQAMSYKNAADFHQDAVNIVDRAGKSGQGAAELISILESNKKNPNPDVMQSFERELKYQYDHATSASEKEHLGLVAAVYAKNDMANISAKTDPETKSFFMGLALNPKYADLPKDVLHHPETREEYNEFLQKTTAYVQSKTQDDPSAKNLTFLNNPSDLKMEVAHADNGLKTPGSSPASAPDRSMGGRTS